MNVNRKQIDPVAIPRTRRNHPLAILTSMPAGKMVPLAAVPMLREDSMSCSATVAVEMMETHELLMNSTFLRVMAFLVPNLALARFEGSRDQHDRSYMGQPQTEGGPTIPYIETEQISILGSLPPIYKYMGLHAKGGDTVSTAYKECYNLIWNHRATLVSQEIEHRERLAQDLAPAFWQRGRFAHVVPDFDQAVIDGEVALSIAKSRLDIHGINVRNSPIAAGSTFRRNLTGAQYVNAAGVEMNLYSALPTLDGGPDLAPIYAELTENNVQLTLANIELAKQTQAWARIRERYEGLDDEWVIDMLMSGMSIPDQAMKQPILLADQTVRFTQQKRYATDSGNLAESAVSGAAMAELSIRVPRLSVGGVVMIVAEAVPDQLYERQQDPYLYTTSVDQYPEALRDTIDPEKVDVVLNKEIDAHHSVPNGVFGYVPLNHKWTSGGPRIGGKFHQPSGGSIADEERQRIWAVETQNPTLSDDFYIVTNIHQKPFLNTTADPFEVAVAGNAVLEGNTQFGGVLVEAVATKGSNYEKVAEKAPVERIEK